ncbi:MAG: ORF6N domain-containing protein [Lachnospiraceae bacterium]|nr:ORF6N domain-containing protein [Lachnospiraceae bacterium]
MTDDKIDVYEPIAIESIKKKIFDIRGNRVMMDNDIATYFGIETKSLNRAMKRNIKRFPDNFCFQLIKEEYNTILRCQFGTLELEQGKYSKYLPFVYTEQGVAMLTSVLHTERAIDASVRIIEAFVEMSHYIRQNRELLPYDELKTLELKQYKLSDRVKQIEDNMLTRADLSDLMKLFDTEIHSNEILILNGEPFKADLAYQKIYKLAKKNIIIIDDYIDLKTLHHLSPVKVDIDITIISDNKAYTPLTLSAFNDFLIEYPGRNIIFIKSLNKVHDRYIILDYCSKKMKIYHCGASSKDAGKKVTTITELKETDIYKDIIEKLLKNPPLQFEKTNL